MNEKLLIEMKSDMYIIPYHEILYLEAEEKKTAIVTEKEEIKACRQLKALEEQLAHKDFFRVSNSHLVNMKNVNKISGNQVHLDNTAITGSPDKIKELINRLKGIK